MNKLERIFHGS